METKTRDRGNGVMPVDSPESSPGETPRSVQIASEGVYSTGDAKRFCRHLLADTMTDRVSDRKARTGCLILGTAVRVAKLEQKYGDQIRFDDQEPTPVAEVDPAEIRRQELLRELAALEASGGAAKTCGPLPKKG